MWKSMIVCTLLAGAAYSADFAACPAAIEVQPQQLAKPVAGWTAAKAAGARHDLWFVTMYDGEPKEMASLVPDISTKLKQGWTLAPQSRVYWLECHYTQTTIVLAKAVPAGVKSCEVTYTASMTLDGYPVIKQIACK